jgi:putative transposase
MASRLVFNAEVVCVGGSVGVSRGRGVEGSEPSIDTFRLGVFLGTMARPLRIEYPGAIYHVLSRGDRREAIFRTEADRKLFLDLLDQTCRRTGWQIHAYCLMDNHFHLVVETPRGNLSTGMQWFLGSYPPAIQSPSPFVGIAENLYMGTWTHVSKSALPLPLIKECQYLALTPFVLP